MRHWFASDALGIVAVAPLLIGLASAARERPSQSEVIEGGMAFVALVVLSDLVVFVPRVSIGSPLRPHSLGQEWGHFFSSSTTLPRIRFHDLRHVHATHLLGSGVHPKTASERLGHSNVGITLDLYSHVLPDMQTDAAALVDDALKAVIQRRSAIGIG